MQILILITLTQLLYLTTQTYCSSPIQNSDSTHNISSITFLNQTTDPGTGQKQIYTYDGTTMQMWALNSNYTTTYISQSNVVDGFYTISSLLYTFPNGSTYYVANSTTTSIQFNDSGKSYSLDIGMTMSFICYVNPVILIANSYNAYASVVFNGIRLIQLGFNFPVMPALYVSGDSYKGNILRFDQYAVDLFNLRNATNTYYSGTASLTLVVSPDWTCIAMYDSNTTVQIFTYNSTLSLYQYTQRIGFTVDTMKVKFQDAYSFMVVTSQYLLFYTNISTTFQYSEYYSNPNASTFFTSLTNLTNGYAVGTSNGMFVTIHCCPIGSFINNGICTTCNTNCLICNMNLYCSKCNANSSVDSNGNCCTNSNTNCALCPSSTTCQTCNSNYYLDYYTQLCLLMSSLLNCQSTNSTGCGTCNSGYYTTVSGYCTNTMNCQNSSTNGKCLACISNYYMDYYTKTCSLTSNLQNCQTPGTTGCGTCNSGYFVSTSGYCASTSNCMNATSSGTCSVCSNNYYLNGTNCIAQSQLSTCTTFNISGCTACNSNSNYLTSTQGCSQTNNCLVADYITGICYNCASSYFLSTAGSCCLKTLAYCTMCALNDSTVCTVCITNAQVNNSVCQCKSGFSISADNKTCVAVQNNVIDNPLIKIETVLTYIFAYLKSAPASGLLQKLIVTLIYNSRLLDTTQLNVSSVTSLGNNYYKITINNPTVDVSNGQVTIDDQNGDLVKFTFNNWISANTKQSLQNSSNYIAAQVLIPIIMFLMLVFYILGYKHNRLISFIQKLSFLRFNLFNIPNATFMFLYSIKFSYYAYGTNALMMAIPSDYIEFSYGNFIVMDTDANILRNASIPIIMTIILFGLRIIGLFVFPETQQHIKKYYFRFVEFFERTAMFPILFFSIATLIFNNRYGRVPSSDPNIYNTCVGFSAISLAYFLFLSIATTKDKVKPEGRYEMLIDYVFNVIDSVVIIQTIGKSIMITLIILIVLRTVVQLTSKYQSADKLQVEDLMLVVAMGLEIAIIGVLNGSASTGAITGLFVLVIILTVTYVSIVLFKKVKAKTNVQVEESESSSNPRTIEKIKPIYSQNLGLV